jgi:hypothetical protein
MVPILHKPGLRLRFYPGGIESGRDRQEKLVMVAEEGRAIEHDRQIGADLFFAAAGQNRDPVFGRV